MVCVITASPENLLRRGNYVSHELLIAWRFPLFGLATARSKLVQTLSYLRLNGLSILLCSPNPLSKLLVIQDHAKYLMEQL